jgi:hypothetical protein
MAMHYGTVCRLFNRVPVVIAAGSSNTCKSLLAKVSASLLGYQKTGIYKEMSTAFAELIIKKSVFFVFNDPESHEEVKAITMKVIMLILFACMLMHLSVSYVMSK